MSRKVAVHARRRRWLLLGLVLGAVVVWARALQLQVLEHEQWAQRAAEQQRQQLVLPASRGAIYDRNGIPLAASQEAFRVAVAPRELTDRPFVAERLRAVLGVPTRRAHEVVTSQRRWVLLPGRYDARVREQLEGVQGIYFERVLDRFYPHGDLAIELLGRVAADGVPLGGLELHFDSLLAGRPGLAVVRRDARGQPIPGALLLVVQPRTGHDLYLTIDYHLQEIAHEALLAALAETGAQGGDLVMADPRTGELLAAASRRADARTWTAATEPYEPGSTLKPFILAALLAENRVSLDDSIFAEDGEYVTGQRTVRDVHGYGWLTVREAVGVSSNIALVKLSEQLTPGEQYRYLRDFGFGTLTGTPYPSESSGSLRRPAGWSRYSQASLAIGYELAVTPLQMLMAYGALAHEGLLMEPRLVREVRARDGRRVREYEPRAVRRVVPRSVAGAVAAVLADAVEAGTGQQASLGAFHLAGKTGTARVVQAGRYLEGAYTSSFAGFFPAENPQLVVLVKLDRPQGLYYGGQTAAPVTRAALEATLAARHSPLDRRAMINHGDTETRGHGDAGMLFAASPRPRVPASLAGGTPYVFAMRAGLPQRTATANVMSARVVPDVIGLSLRDAVRALHAAGFRVRLDGSGAVSATLPEGGAYWSRGAVVHVLAGGAS